MKNWTAPEVTELNISETANGEPAFYSERTYEFTGPFTGNEYEYTTKGEKDGTATS